MVAISAACWIWPTEPTLQFLVRNPTTVGLTLFIFPSLLKSLCWKEVVIVCVLIEMAVLGWRNWGPANSEMECKDCFCLLLSRVWFFCDPMDCSPPSPPSLGFFRQEYWNGLPFPSPGDLPNPGIEPASYALSGGFFITEPPGKPSLQCDFMQII